MSTIPGLGGRDAAALQRALMDAAERATADEAELLAGTGGTGRSGESAATGVRRGAGQAQQTPQQPAEAIIVEIGKQAEAEVALEGKWLTTPKPETPAAPQAPGRQPVAGVQQDEPRPGVPSAQVPGQPDPIRPGAGPAPTTRPSPAQPGASSPAQPGGEVPAPPTTLQQPQSGATQPASATARAAVADVRDLPLDQLVTVLKGSGISFKQAVKVLTAIQLQQPLPAKAALRAMWDETEAAPRAAGSPRAARAQAVPAVMSAPLDQLVRDRSWHRANAAAQDQPTRDAAGQEAGPTAHVESPRPAVPTLATVVVNQPVNQVYVAGLTTAEYQRLVVMLGRNVPDWFGAVRGSRGLRGLMENRGYARLNTTRVAGMRLGAWALGLSSMGILWTAGLRWDMWW